MINGDARSLDYGKYEGMFYCCLVSLALNPKPYTLNPKPYIPRVRKVPHFEDPEAINPSGGVSFNII